MRLQGMRNRRPIEAEEVNARAISLGRMSFRSLHIFENWLHLVKRRIERVPSFDKTSFRAVSNTRCTISARTNAMSASKGMNGSGLEVSMSWTNANSLSVYSSLRSLPRSVIRSKSLLESSFISLRRPAEEMPRVCCITSLSQSEDASSVRFLGYMHDPSSFGNVILSRTGDVWDQKLDLLVKIALTAMPFDRISNLFYT